MYRRILDNFYKFKQLFNFRKTSYINTRSKSNSKISVITPSLNNDEHIERAIKSVLSQDYENYEHIVVDGGSKDNTLDILNKFPHLHWISEPDNGQADAMNKGFGMSSGDIVVYLNADDYFFEGAFSAAIHEFEKGAQFVVGNILIISERLGSEFTNYPRIKHKGMLRHWEPNAFCHNPVGYFYTRKVQEECPFNTENYSTMDLEFLLDASSKFTFNKVEHTLGCYIDSFGTKTHKTQLRPDYWSPETFPYVDSHLAKMSANHRRKFKKDRAAGYAEMQLHMNRLAEEQQQDIK